MSSEVRKAMTILYKVHNGLYVNLTNRCPCACTFCERQTRDHVSEVNDAPLWLEHEPSVEEVIAEFEKTDVAPYEEIVFCGFGEPTERLDALLEIAKYLKAHYDKPIRINTNGLGVQNKTRYFSQMHLQIKDHTLHLHRMKACWSLPDICATITR